VRRPSVLSRKFPGRPHPVVIPNVVRNLLEKQILRFAQDDNFL
jgi:hypothetical protein